MTLTTDQLRHFARACRELGISKFRDGDVEIEFFADVPLASAPEPVAESPREVKPGRDGLTPDEQEALYGRVLDAKG